MKLIEAYGTGIQKIFSAYAGQARQPDIETGPNSFKLVLPRCGEEINENEPLLPAEQQIMELLTNKNFIRRSEVNEALGVSQVKNMGEEKIQNTGRKSLKMKAEDIQDREPALR